MTATAPTAASLTALASSPEIDKVAAAIALVQAGLGSVHKDKTGKIQMKDGGSYQYKYADLATILELLREPFQENGLALIQRPLPDRDGARLQTIIMHQSGQWIGDAGIFIPTTKKDDPKAFGSAYSYARRYALTAMLGIAQHDDDAEKAGARAKAAVPKSGPKVDLVPKEKRDELEVAIQSLPAEFAAQIGDKLRAEGIVWKQLTVAQHKKVSQWQKDCAELAS